MVRKGLHCDVEDFDAIRFYESLIPYTSNLSVLITMTPNQAPHLKAWARLGEPVQVIVRLNYGYHPVGTIPDRLHPGYTRFLEAAKQIIAENGWVWGWIIGNEPNNPTEWPNERTLEIDDVYYTLHFIMRDLPHPARIGLTPLDPYNPTGGGSLYWQRKLLERFQRDLRKPAFYTFHFKTQWALDPLSGEDYRFMHPPYLGLSANFGLPLMLLAMTVHRLGRKPIVIGECNPIRKTGDENWSLDPSVFGWPDDPWRVRQWIRLSWNFFKLISSFVPGVEIHVIYYRWARDQWELRRFANLRDIFITLL